MLAVTKNNCVPRALEQVALYYGLDPVVDAGLMDAVERINGVTSPNMAIGMASMMLPSLELVFVCDDKSYLNKYPNVRVLRGEYINLAEIDYSVRVVARPTANDGVAHAEFELYAEPIKGRIYWAILVEE